MRRPSVASRSLWLTVVAATCWLTGLTGCSSDGSAPGSRSFVLSDPERPGPVSFDTREATFNVDGFGTYKATIFHPLLDGESAPWPALVLLNGFSATAPMMTWLSEHLASHGYVVLAVTPPNPWSLDVTQWARGFLDGLDLLERESARDDSPIAGTVDITRLGGIGLSMGGAGALEAAGIESRLDAVVALAPGWSDIGAFVFQDTFDAAGHITVPTQIQVGSQDCLVGTSGPRGYYQTIPARKQFLEISGGNHIGYINEGLATIAEPLITEAIPIDCAPTVPYSEQHRLGAKYATMWFDEHLYGTDHWDDALHGSGLESDLTSGDLTEAQSAEPTT